MLRNIVPTASRIAHNALRSSHIRPIGLACVRAFSVKTVQQGKEYDGASVEFHRHSTHYRVTSHDMLKKLDVDLLAAGYPHYKAQNFGDKVGLAMVKTLRSVSKIFYRRKYTHYACTLETVAAVPGMVAGMFHHLKSLRKMEHTLRVKTLLDEAENERMHLMAFLEISKPTLGERAFVMSAQGVYFAAYSFFYLLFPRIAHRFVGYLEEEAVKSYTEMLRDIDNKVVPNPPAPLIAKQYWNLPADATLRDMILVIRADEMDHRDVNHEFADAVSKAYVPFEDTPQRIY